jgi:hyaluronoglucosaminidase
MPPFGVMEIFYGTPWSEQDRASYASFLKEIGFQFYIYGPKADASLRRHWQKPWSEEELKKYREMRTTFSSKGLRFGMALSPLGLFGENGLVDREKLRGKITSMVDLGVDILGLFFDDMKSSPEMADRQLEIVRFVQSCAGSMRIVFCPSYYCMDPLLDFLFGEQPKGYLDAIGAGVPSQVEILWTGEQIISHQVSAEHLDQVAKVLRRKPFICDNFYSNDGPINCNYLRLLPPTGRKREMFEHAKGWAFNPMNQCYLSQLVLRAFSKYSHQGADPSVAFGNTIRELCTPWVAELILERHGFYAESGLDALPPEEQIRMRQHLSSLSGKFERELLQWLDNHYAVGMEAMLNQSCFDGT